MKRFFATLSTAILLITSTLTTVAFDASYDDYYVEDLSPIECSIFIDGKAYPCEPGYSDGYDTYFRYTSVADALGFKTTFSAETGRIYSTRDDVCVSFNTIGEDIEITYPDGTGTKPYFLYNDLGNIDGRMYISDYGIRTLLNASGGRHIYASSGVKASLNCYTEAGINALIRSADKELSVLNEMQAELVNQDYVSNGTNKITVKLGSDFFGIEGAGESVITITSAKRGKKAYVKLETKGKGLINFVRMLYDDFSVWGSETFPETTSVEWYFDGTTNYVKGAPLVESKIQYEDYGFTYDFPEETNAVLDKWVYSDYNSDDDLAQYVANPPSIGTFIVNYAFDNAYERAPEETIAVFLSLFSDKNFTVKNTAQGKTYTYKLDKNALARALEPTLATMTENEKAEFEKNMALFDINITVKQSTKQTGATSTAKGKISVSNIQNPWNKQVFSLDVSFESSETYSFKKAQTFTFPDISNAVNITEYMGEFLAEHEVFYDDDDFYEDDYEDYE